MSKYGNRKTMAGGILFDSKKEAEHYLWLLSEEQAERIYCLELQPKFPLVVEGVKIADYYADFRYCDAETHRQHVVDVKGVRTPVYRLKKKLVRALYGVEVEEV